MIKRLRGKENLINFAIAIVGLLGLYLILAWASYSPLDNAWSVASSATENQILNKTGSLGAWIIDLLYAFFGKLSFLVPFSITGASAYALITRMAEELTFKRFLLWMGSFSLLMLGLSGIATSVLSNSAYYLSGGFIGSMLHTLLDSTIGQFGTLFVSMLCVAVGFYFCSGQSLIPLFTQFYDWVTAKDEKKAEETVSSEPESVVPDLSEEFVEQTEKMRNVENQFTDPTHFKRPNIHGLRPTTSSENELTDIKQTHEENSSMFKVDTELALPSVNVQGFNPQDEVIAPEKVEEEVLHIDLPKVILNPQVEEQSEMQAVDIPYELTSSDFVNPAQFKVHLPENTLSEEATEEWEDEYEEEEERVVEISEDEVQPPAFMQEFQPTAKPIVKLMPFEEVEETQTEEDFESERAKAFAEMEQARLAEVEARAKAAGLEQTFHKITEGSTDFSTDLTAQVKIRTEPTPSEFSTPIKATTSDSTVYPKGYGDTLIHPLLQKNKVLEKPTTPLPTLDLLAEHKQSTRQITEEEILETSRRIETALANYGVKATVEDVLVGPVVTRYEIKPAAGVKAAKVTSLASDLARELMFKAIRITEVVPGKPYMGIETPNQHRETVWLRDVLSSDEFVNTKATLPMALGKDISGNPVVVDMAKMPHLLVAGQTGGGKSVGVNTMILSLLFKLTPEQVRFIMIDPKVVELSIYNDIPHLLTPVVTDMKKAANALRWAVEEMERRYLLVSHLQVRNIEGYNAKIDQAADMQMPIPDPTWRPRDSMDALPPPLTKLSYIVLIVDEFADLMMSAGKEVEEYIMRIAQKARAVGIHLILATQRPSTDVITGVIKANIPSRIAFTVASQIDSRTILDAGGAEALLGRGDMLYSGAGSPDIIRVHGAFMEDDEVSRIADNWRARGKPQYLDSIVESLEEVDTTNRSALGDLDPLFDEVVEFVVESGITSISGIQRRFSLGFNRAGRIIDQLEAQGIISEPGKGGKREVLR
ncbi:DNA translocase FtsK [Actinobacillus minor]|uniref:DNA translocase FtsK n=1 Tax=Actinobacillus minor TaxID=51047 RepID=UPI0023F44C71|nr:DNA translocase FtsK [Actinobacillus minor]MDD6909849.1 DNA translocase FtsK 4TM domain-containing protein [Actinobacillus minor]MDY4712986.1 DNA translocase FtsK 4TM domain-containing protein [Actinobacillus minor]